MGIATGVIFIMLANFQLAASVGAQGGSTNCIGGMCTPGMDMVIQLGEQFPPFFNASIVEGARLSAPEFLHFSGAFDTSLGGPEWSTNHFWGTSTLIHPGGRPSHSAW